MIITFVELELYKLSGRGRLCDGDIDILRNWKFSLGDEDDSLLTRSGELEMYRLGER